MKADLVHIEAMHSKDISELDIVLEQEYDVREARADLNGHVVDINAWEAYRKERFSELDLKYKRYGYVIRERYSHIIPYIPTVPEAPIDNTILTF